MKLIQPAGLVTLLVLTAAVARLSGGILEDRGIEDAINRSVVFREVLIDRSMVQLYIRYGLVEMRGQVADERERDLLTYFVKGLPDVKQVDNRLFIDSSERRGTERWRAIRLRSFLAMDGGFDVSRTEIAFAGGEWQLVGEVADETSRAAIVQRLRELSPQNPLAVTLTVSAKTSARKYPIDDASIAAIARSTLELSSDLAITDPSVSCLLGKLVLRGSVRNEADKERATRIAAVSRGVASVANELTVHP